MGKRKWNSGQETENFRVGPREVQLLFQPHKGNYNFKIKNGFEVFEAVSINHTTRLKTDPSAPCQVYLCPSIDSGGKCEE